MDQVDRRAKRWALGVFLLIFSGFLAKQGSYFPELFERGFHDATSEAFVHQGAVGFVEQGLAPTFGLQRYPGFKSEGPLQEFLAKEKQDLYTHFFPGPEYVLAFFYKINGIQAESLAWARLPSLLHLLLGLLLLVFSANRRFFPDQPFAKTWLLLPLIFAPAIYSGWGWSLFGHAHVTGYLFCAMALGIWAEPLLRGSKRRRFLVLSGATVLGILSQYFLIEFAFVMAAAPLALGLLDRRATSLRPAITLSVCVGLGLFLGFLLHFCQIALAFESWKLAWIEQLGTASVRGDTRGQMSRIQMLGQFSRHAQDQFRIGSLMMLGLGSFLAWMTPQARVVRVRSILALTGACAAGYCFPLLLKVHSETHFFRVPRVFLLEFVVFVLIVMRFAYEQRAMLYLVLKNGLIRSNLDQSPAASGILSTK